MIDKVVKRTVTANQRQLMEYLRGGDWVTVAKLPVGVGPRTLYRITHNGWIERRNSGPRFEIKLTPRGLAALKSLI